MMQCAQCDHWVHAKCEGLSGELGEYQGCDLNPVKIPVLSPPQALRGEVG